ncbi:hypothetical protein SLITO_v1c03940 [Spiroplasma litorale]|uniref:Motility-associated protein Scm1 n=1 Tax=Spiroplasma litorale TaxID=216942 RepID=A0A0K1W1R7_9MOLU|nr:motility-associated protein Scm1 [Spiroplasma litorale]AKX34047.1 hypothetical protein SLITO_v1c03940 [Spiroplasma litorale]
MKQKGIFFTLLFFTLLFLVSIIMSVSLFKSININKELQNSGVDESIWNNITNPFELAYFIFGYKGFWSIMTLNSFNFVVFSLFWVFLTPLSFSFFFLFLTIYIFTIIIHNIRRDYKYKTAKFLGKWGMYISFIVLLVFISITLGLFSGLEVEFKKVDSLNDYFKSGFFDSFSVISLLKVISNGYLFKINKFNTQYILGENFNYGLLVASLVFGVVFLPIIGITFIIFGSIWIATFISIRNSSHSKFRMWLKNIRIDSKREFYSLILKNEWLWIVTAAFLVTVAVPGLVHPYKNSFQIILSIISICSIPLVFTPLIIGMARVVKIKRFNYNLLMFLQIMILLFTVLSLQLIIWILFKEEIKVHSSVSSFVPFLTITAAIFAEFGFVKLQKR